jgi:hypothetical protein
MLFSFIISDLENFGLTLIGNVPHDPKAIEAISNRVAFPKPTHYGIDFVVRYLKTYNCPMKLIY